MHKLWNILSVINLSIAIGKARNQAAEYCSSPGYNLDSLSTISRSYWEPLGWMTNLFFHFLAFLDISKLFLMVEPVALLSFSRSHQYNFSAHHIQSHTQSSLPAFKGVERAVAVDG